MYFKAFRPSAALESYIRSYYYLQIDTDEKAMGQITRYPTDGGPKLIINLGDAFLAGDNENNLKPFSGCRLIGSLSRQLISKTGGRIAFLAIRFIPGKIEPFFNVRGSELTDGSAALDALWGTYGKVFEQRLRNFDTIQQMLTFVECVLLSQLEQQTLLDIEITAALDLIWQTNGQIRINELAEQVGLSLRQFERRFTNLVGLNPKRLCRISRFANILSSFDNSHKQSWVGKAMDGGYSDHAHFIRECKFFTGLSPIIYLAQRSPLEVAVWSKYHSLLADKVGTFSSTTIKNPLLK